VRGRVRVRERDPVRARDRDRCPRPCCERRRREIARCVWTAGVPPASPGLQGVRDEFTTSRDLAGTLTAIGPLAPGRQDACGPCPRCGRRRRQFAPRLGPRASRPRCLGRRLCVGSSGSGSSTSTRTTTRSMPALRAAPMAIRAPPGNADLPPASPRSEGVRGIEWFGFEYEYENEWRRARVRERCPCPCCERRRRVFPRGVWSDPPADPAVGVGGGRKIVSGSGVKRVWT
jgi:hypothetical protein